MKSIILAAGFATRLYPLTLNKPKHLLEIENKPIISYIVEKIREISNDEIFVITNNVFFKDFAEWKEKIGDKNMNVINDGVSFPEKKLGAIGDLLFAIDKNSINDDLFVICGDNFFSYSLKKPFGIFKKEKKDLSIFFDTHDLNESKRMGVALVKNNLLYSFKEKPQFPKSTICSASTYFFRKETSFSIFPPFEIYYLYFAF